MGLGDLYSLLHELGTDFREIQWDSIPEKPLACYPSDLIGGRNDIPEVKGTCDLQTVKDAYKKVAETCGSDQRTIPCLSRDFSILGNKHSLLNIIYHLNRFQMEDFRGANTFHRLAFESQVQNFSEVVKSREINILYPGSGSHMGPLLTVCSMIDQGIIDHGNLFYTELDKYSLLRIRDYLSFWQEQGIFKNLEMEVLDFGYRKEFVFQMDYQGKDISLTFSIISQNEIQKKSKERDIKGKLITRTYTEEEFPQSTPQMDKDFWAPEYAINEADLLIVHDSFGREELKHYADRYLQGNKTKLLMLDQNHLDGGRGFDRNTEKTYEIPPIPTQTESFIQGFFGCNSFSPGYGADWSSNVRLNPQGELEEYREGHYKARTFYNVRGDLHSLNSSSGGAMIVTVNPVQNGNE